MNPRFLLFAIVTLIAIAACDKKKDESSHDHTGGGNETVQTDTVKKSIPKEEHAQVGGAHIMIKYHAPAVRGRTIWGGLVPYGDVWVTGAHSATSVEIDRDFIVEGKEIAAGKYALFTIPDKESWTIIINKNWDQHLADEYDQKDDVIRFTTTPEALDSIQERLKYAIVSKSETDGAIEISWEKLKVTLPFTIK